LTNSKKKENKKKRRPQVGGEKRGGEGNELIRPEMERSIPSRSKEGGEAAFAKRKKAGRGSKGLIRPRIERSIVILAR